MAGKLSPEEAAALAALQEAEAKARKDAKLRMMLGISDEVLKSAVPPVEEKTKKTKSRRKRAKERWEPKPGPERTPPPALRSSDDLEEGGDPSRTKRKHNLQKFEKMIYISSMPKAQNLRDMGLDLQAALQASAEEEEEAAPSSRPLTDRAHRKPEVDDIARPIELPAGLPPKRELRRKRSRSIVSASSDDVPISHDLQQQLARKLGSEKLARVSKHKSERSPTSKAAIEEILSSEQDEPRIQRRRRLTFGHNDGTFVQAVLIERSLRKPSQPVGTSESTPNLMRDDIKKSRLGGLRTSLKKSLVGKRTASTPQLEEGSEVWGSWIVDESGIDENYGNDELLDPEFKAIITAQDTFGWNLEHPWKELKKVDDYYPQIEYNQFESMFYLDNFFQKDHTNFLATDKTLGDVVISLRKDKLVGMGYLIFRTRKGVVKMQVCLQNCKKQASKAIVKELALNENRPPKLALTGLRVIDHPDLQDALVKFEKSEVFKRFKFGVVVVKEGQTKDDQYFSNVDGSERWYEFLTVIGKKITLAGWKDYAGGLDVSGVNSTGEHSVYTSYYSNQNNYEIMYHVTTYLPFQEDDVQRVERKRHLGNDVVNIIFNDSGQPFDPLSIVTNFIHVYVIISVDAEATKRNKETTYRVEIAKQDGLPPFGPPLPSPPLFKKSELRDWLLPKLINAERASFAGGSIRFNLNSTRKTLLKNIVDNFG